MHAFRAPMLVAAIALGAAACSSSRTVDRTASDSTATAAAATVPNVLVVKTSDYAFQAPDSIKAGLTTVHLVTNPSHEVHQVGIIRLDSAKTSADFLKAIKSGPALPKWAVEIAGVNPPAPGQSADATLNLAPGNYLLVCLVPSPDGVPHILKGMWRPLTVTGPAVAAAPLAGDVELKLSDYAFALSKPLTAGSHVIRVVNVAPQTHEVFLIRLAPGKTPADVASWISKQQGPPPGEPLGGVSGLGAGGSASFPVTLTAGDYGLLCFIPDAKDGKPHVAHGMLQQIHVS